jgi:hypothetical protein
MPRARFTFAVLGWLIFSAPLLADESLNPSPAYSKRQLADCMTRRMYANRTLSYNDAAKACKDELRGRKTDAALNNAPKPVS